MAQAKADLSGAGLRIGIVRSRFNEEIGLAMLKACSARLKDLGVTEIRTETVPGALEAPIVLQKLANTGNYDALIALGAVIRGETYHFEVVSNESARGFMDLTLQGYAIGNGVLTVEDEQQAIVRADPSQGDKGGGAARAALALYDLRTKYAP